MRTYAEADIIASVRDALQFIACFHPVDFIRHLTAAYEAEAPGPARDAMAQLPAQLAHERARQAAHVPGHRTVNVFVKIGIGARIEATRSLQEIVDEAVRQAYTAPDNPLRASVVSDPLFLRPNTRDNTPSVVHAEIVAGDLIDITVAAKGGGSENKAKFAVLNPADSVADWVVEDRCDPRRRLVSAGRARHRGRRHFGEGDAAGKREPDGPARYERPAPPGPQDKTDALRLEILDRVNALGIGAQGLGGATTVLDVKIRTFPTHAASMRWR